MKRTLWVITELFPPEETSTGFIMGEIANVMTKKYDVKVICGPAVYDASKMQDPNGKISVDESIEIIRVNSVPEDKSSNLSRVKKFILMSLQLYRVAKVCIHEGDHVLMVTNPFPLIILMGYLRRRRRFTMSMLVHDIMPESLFTDIKIPSPVYNLALNVFNKAYASTDQLISIGRDMTEVLEEKCKSYSHRSVISLIENWGDVENVHPSELFESEKITIQYAGNIGNAQGVGEFVDVLHEACCKDVAFSIWGTGSAETQIKEKVKEYDMSDCVHFHGAYLRSQQQMVLNSCDIALVRLVEGMYGLGVPSKTYNILAAGKPILYVGEENTEVWRMVKENGNGVCFEPNDTLGLKDFLQKLNTDYRTTLRAMGAISRKLAEDKYSKEAILKKYVDLI